MRESSRRSNALELATVVVCAALLVISAVQGSVSATRGDWGDVLKQAIWVALFVVAVVVTTRRIRRRVPRPGADVDPGTP